MTRDQFNALRRNLQDEERLLAREQKALPEVPNLRDYWPHEDAFQAAVDRHYAVYDAIQMKRDAVVARLYEAQKQITE